VLERSKAVARLPVVPYSRTVRLECARVFVVFVWWRDSFRDTQQCFPARICVFAEECEERLSWSERGASQQATI
jgi:hypothetical protein